LELLFSFSMAVIYWTTTVYYFDTTIFWDDQLLLDQRLVYPNVNPFHFWLWHSGVNKAWPMSYFINWCASFFEAQQFLILRALLGFFHFLNAIFLYKIIRSLNPSVAISGALFS
jgi:hypothetical protein